MTQGVIVYEAEDLNLDDFKVVNGANASGGQLIKITGGDGIASDGFTGAAGSYDVTIWVQDESDGQSTIELLIDGVVVGTIVLDLDGDGGGSNNGGFTPFTLDNIQIPAGATFGIRAYKDGGEYVRIDKIEFAPDGAGAGGGGAGGGGSGGGGPSGGSEVLMSEGFGPSNLATSPNVVSSDFYGANGAALSNGANDGDLTFAAVDLSGYQNATLTLDARLVAGSFETWGTQYGDRIRIELIDQDGNVILLDQFTGQGYTLTGSGSGQVIDQGGFDGLNYVIPQGVSSFQLRISSDISACGEKIAFDNIKIVADPGGGAPPVVVTLEALDNAYTVGEAEDIAANIIADDLLNGAVAQPGALTLTDIAIVNADGSQIQMTVGQSFTVTTAGGRDVTVTVNADGTFSYTGNGNLDDLLNGQTDSFRLAYTVSTGGETTQTHDVGFDIAGLAAGTIVSGQIAGVTISALRAGHSGENAAMIFDADNPTGGDWDLSQPGEGNVLIITEDFDSSDPDDNAGGGTFFFDFDAPSTVTSLTFLDTEEPTPQIRLYDQAGNLIASLAGPTTANGGMAAMVLGVAGVAKMEIDLQGSGAIAALVFDQTDSSQGVTDTAYVDVTINGEGAANLAPVALDDLNAGDEDAAAINGNVLVNDSDPDGDPISVIAAGGQAVGTALAVAGVSSEGRALDGTLTVNSNGAYSFVPGSGYAAMKLGETISFAVSYTIADPAGLQDSATLTITVNGLNDPPVALDDISAADENVAVVSGNILTNDFDPNGDAITVIAAAGQTVGSAIALSGVSSAGRALDGNLTVNANGSYSFVPGTGYGAMSEGESISFTVSYAIEDVHGAQDTADLTITINGLNEAPVATANAYLIDEDALLSGNILTDDTGNGLDFDPNGDAFSILELRADGNLLGAMGGAWTVTSQGGRTGTLTVNTDGSFAFDPGTGFDDLNEGDTDSIILTYTIEDIHGARDTANFIIDVQGKSGGGGPSGPAINVMFVVDASSSMFVDKGVALDVVDANGDGLDQTSFDLAYLGIQDFIAELQSEAVLLGVNLNVGITGFDDGMPNQAGFDYASYTYSATTGLSAWNTNVLTAGTSGDSFAAPGLARGTAWFASLGASAATDDNQMVLLTDAQLDTAGAAAEITGFQSAYGGNVHARFVGSLNDLGANFAALASTIDELDSTGLDPLIDAQMLAWDLATVDAALTTTDILDLV